MCFRIFSLNYGVRKRFSFSSRTRLPYPMGELNLRIQSLSGPHVLSNYFSRLSTRVPMEIMSWIPFTIIRNDDRSNWVLETNKAVLCRLLFQLHQEGRYSKQVDCSFLRKYSSCQWWPWLGDSARYIFGPLFGFQIGFLVICGQQSYEFSSSDLDCFTPNGWFEFSPSKSSFLLSTMFNTTIPIRMKTLGKSGALPVAFWFERLPLVYAETGLLSRDDEVIISTGIHLARVTPWLLAAQSVGAYIN